MQPHDKPTLASSDWIMERSRFMFVTGVTMGDRVASLSAERWRLGAYYLGYPQIGEVAAKTRHLGSSNRPVRRVKYT